MSSRNRSEKDRVVECIEELSIVRDRQVLRLVLSRLPQEVQSRIEYAEALRPYVYSIVETCESYPGGLQELQAAIKWFEGNSRSMRMLELALMDLSLALSAEVQARSKKISEKTSAEAAKNILYHVSSEEVNSWLHRQARSIALGETVRGIDSRGISSAPSVIDVRVDHY